MKPETQDPTLQNAVKKRGRKPAAEKDAKPAEPVRKMRSVAVGAVVAPLLEPALAKKGVALARIIPHWKAICPMLAAYSAPESVKGDTLTVAVDSDTVKQEMMYMTGQVVESVNRLLGYEAVTRLRIITRGGGTHAAGGPKRGHVTASLPEAQETRDRAAALCKHVRDDALRHALEGLAATFGKRKTK
jgi:hypothetical protein